MDFWDCKHRLHAMSFFRLSKRCASCANNHLLIFIQLLFVFGNVISKTMFNCLFDVIWRVVAFLSSLDLHRQDDDHSTKIIWKKKEEISTGPTERTPKKPEYLIARSQLTERGPLVRSHSIVDGKNKNNAEAFAAAEELMRSMCQKIWSTATTIEPRRNRSQEDLRIRLYVL